MILYKIRLIYVLSCITFFVVFSRTLFAEDLLLLSQVEKHGITWTFSEPVPVGRFINGDYYVVGSVTITMIDPMPDGGRNGSVLNLPANGRAGFDNRQLGNTYDASQVIELPLAMTPGDILVSTISGGDPNTMERIWFQGTAESCILDAAVLTCLPAQVSTDAFRPGYCDPEQKVYYASEIRWSILPNLKQPTSTPNVDFFSSLTEGPWLDSVFYGFTTPVNRMPAYGREITRAVSIVSLMICTDIPMTDRERLMTNFIQIGIDLYGIIKGGGQGWIGHGGHGNGRKWAIILTGLLLGDEDMQNPKLSYPDIVFSEDEQTMYGNGWTGATALYAGHHGQDGEQIHPGWGPYEHLEPADWISNIGENYRRCCTSIAWVGEALAARILHAETIWNHDAFFDYVDRWMTEDDTEFVEQIYLQRGWDYSANWERQGQTWDEFVNDMWVMYRNNLPPPPENKTLNLFSPNGGEVLVAGSSYDIQWESSNVSNITIQYSTDNGENWDTIVENIESGIAFYNWMVPDIPSESCLIRIRDATDVSLEDRSNMVFTIVTQTSVELENDQYQESHDLSIMCMPNPFNTMIKVIFTLPEDGHARLVIYNLLGQLVKVLVDEVMSSGIYSIVWDASNDSGESLPSGIYVVNMESTFDTSHCKILLLR